MPARGTAGDDSTHAERLLFHEPPLTADKNAPSGHLFTREDATGSSNEGLCRMKVRCNAQSAGRAPCLSRQQRNSPTRAQHDRRRTTQSRAGCGHCPPSWVRALPTRGSGGQCPPGESATTGSSLSAGGCWAGNASRRNRICAVTPQARLALREPCLSRKQRYSPTRAQHDRREPT